jgi:hypothetical protein
MFPLMRPHLQQPQCIISANLFHHPSNEAHHLGISAAK